MRSWGSMGFLQGLLGAHIHQWWVGFLTLVHAFLLLCQVLPFLGKFQGYLVPVQGFLGIQAMFPHHYCLHIPLDLAGESVLVELLCNNSGGTTCCYP